MKQQVSVSLYHCGVDPLIFKGKTWEVSKPPFDDTNKPASWVGRGAVVEESLQELKYVDESGLVLHFVPGDGINPPNCD
jgi:hypothetical protein